MRRLVFGSATMIALTAGALSATGCGSDETPVPQGLTMSPLMKTQLEAQRQLVETQMKNAKMVHRVSRKR